MTMTSGSLAERRAFWAANERNTDPADPAAVQAAVDALWSAAGAKPPKVMLCASPTRLAMTRFLWHWLPIGALSAAAAVVAAVVLSVPIVAFIGLALTRSMTENDIFATRSIVVVLAFWVWWLSASFISRRHDALLERIVASKVFRIKLSDFMVTTRPVNVPERFTGVMRSRTMIGSREDLEDAVRGEADPGVVALLTLCGPVYPGVLGQAFVLDRPAAVAVDTEGRLHNSEGPAVVWRDGARMFFLRGHEVTEDEFEGRDGVILGVLTERKAELRRAVCEHIGWERILRKVGGTILDDSEDASTGSLIEAPGWIQNGDPEANVKWPFEERLFLRRRTQTGKWVATAVPNDVGSVRDARAWLDAGGDDGAGQPAAA